MTAVGFGLLVQRLPRAQDRVLVIGRVAGARNGDERFSAGEVAELFDSLRLPSPGNVSQELARLKSRGLVLRRRSSSSWSLTPEGEEEVVALVGHVDLHGIEGEVVRSGTAELAGVAHSLIPPEMAPVRYLPAVRSILDRHRFERNVFCMTRFPASGHADDPVATAIEALRSTLARQGLVLHLASDRNADDELLPNIVSHLWACKYGIALIENLDPRPGASREINDNVLIEVGAMLATGRRCALLKDQRAPALPTDFVAQIYKTLDIGDPAAVAQAAGKWIVEDLGRSSGAPSASGG